MSKSPELSISEWQPVEARRVSCPSCGVLRYADCIEIGTNAPRIVCHASRQAAADRMYSGENRT